MSKTLTIYSKKSADFFYFRAVIKWCVLAECVGLIDATKMTLLAHNFKLYNTLIASVFGRNAALIVGARFLIR